MLQTYRAVQCTALTGPDALALVDLARPVLQPDEVRIKVHAAGLGFPDLLMTRGEYQLKLDPPFVPGMEFAGEIIECGAGVVKWSLGDRVMAGGRGGAFAEEAVVPAAALTLLPLSLSFDEGACYRSGALTALHALVDRGAMLAGETLLVLGAAGGVGLAAVQLGKHLGGTVVGTGSSPEKRAAVLAAGADYALDPAAPDFRDQVKALTGGKGVNLVFDPVGGALALAATRTLAWGGRYLIVGFASGVIPAFPANHALIKGHSTLGLRAGESGRRDPALAAQNSERLARFAADGIMRPPISHRYTLACATDAFKAMEARMVIGRAIILPFR
jgi:NADPH:quinone reductase